ncbi:DUF368 domain-containing protein [Nocardia uniformis]|uniref:DUF368 domain-containing protein n=2 Tax=Nocardia uniformis TaxID=53432 RepID=A0A849CFC5_9NOCA|nr:DUF368 domain-containing protein [Nocardia uniformis]
MGIAETVPGFSGGTVALITGIYDRLILSAGHTVSGLRLLAVDLPRGDGTARSAAEFRRVDWPFIASVLAGMAVCAVLASKLLVPLVENHPQQTYAVFFGLVLVSLWVPYSESGRQWSPGLWAAAGVAAAAAFVLTGLPPSEIKDPHPLLIVAVASVAICALVMPGVSGSFILLATGMYTATFTAVNERDLGYLALFALGAFIGLSAFVKLLQWLLEHHHRVTLVIMTGLLVGSLRALWPWQTWDDDDSRALLAPSSDVPITVGLIALGSLIVVAVLVIERRTRAVHPAHSTGSAISEPRADSTRH